MPAFKTWAWRPETSMSGLPDIGRVAGRSARVERPMLWICGRVLRTGANPAGRVDSPWATPRRCPPPDHTFAPLAHELHSINHKISMKQEKTKTVQSGSI